MTHGARELANLLGGGAEGQGGAGRAVRNGGAAGQGGVGRAVRNPYLDPLRERWPHLPPDIRPCPACGILTQKIDGDDEVMCGCEARPAGGTYEKALEGGGCGYIWNFETGEPMGQG